jgi:hypothetical protein
MRADFIIRKYCERSVLTLHVAMGYHLPLQILPKSILFWIHQLRIHFKMIDFIFLLICLVNTTVLRILLSHHRHRHHHHHQPEQPLSCSLLVTLSQHLLLYFYSLVLHRRVLQILNRIALLQQQQQHVLQRLFPIHSLHVPFRFLFSLTEASQWLPVFQISLIRIFFHSNQLRPCKVQPR